MKKAVVAYIAVLLLFFGATASIFHWRTNSADHYLSDFTVPAQLQKININSASAEQLQIIPGIGPAISQRIIAYREENGPFTSIEDITNVKGIGDQLLSHLRTYTTVGD